MSDSRPPAAPSPWTEQRFQALTRHSGDIISLLDAEGHLLFNSAAAERISGFTLTELSGIDTFELMHPDDRERVGAALRQVLAAPGAVVTVQYRYRTKAGGWLWMEAVATNRLHDPELAGVVAISRDISERRRAEEERRAIEARLLQVQKVESLAALAGGVAHEFNNLLVGILGALELSRDEVPADHPAVEPLGIGLRAAHRAAALCRQLLAAAGRAEPHLEPLALKPLLEEAGDLLGVSAGRRVDLRREVAPGLPAVTGDPAQLRQVLVNLVTNAAEALGEGGGIVALRADAAEVSRAELDACELGADRQPGRYVRLRVEDRGRGILPEHLGRLFDPFFSTKGPGRGLGLAAALGVVRRHGGCVRVESQPGQGTTVTVLLPAAVPAGPVAAPAAWRGHGKVLVADDEPLVRSVAHRLLERLGFEVEEAADGVAAAEAVEREPARFAAVLLDVTMPRLDGLGALARIRAVAAGLPVFLSSGLLDPAARTRAEGLGVTGLIDKPYDRAQLTQALRKGLG